MAKDNFGIIIQAMNSILGSKTETTPRPVAFVDNAFFASLPYSSAYLGPSPSAGKPILLIWRKEAQKIKEIVGYLETPLYIGDLISPVPNVGLWIQFLLGGRAVVRSESLVQIENEKNARIIKASLKLSDFKKEKCPIRLTTAGSVVGIRG